MAVPISGAISLAKIRNEFEQNNYNHSLYGYTTGSTSLGDMWDGTYGAINANSTDPGGTTFTSKAAAPDKISELMGYDHDAAPAFSWGTPSTFPNTFFDGEMETTDGSRAQIATAIKISHSSGQVNYQAVDMGRNMAPSGSTFGLNTDSLRNVTYTGTLTALYIQYIFTSIDHTIVEESNSSVGEIRKHTTAHINEPDYSGYNLVQTLSTGTNQNITGTITQIGHTGNSSYWVLLETGSSGGTDTDTIRLRNGTVACKLYANSTSGPSVTLFTGKTVDMLGYSSDDSS